MPPNHAPLANPRRVAFLQSCSYAASRFTVIVGACVLVGWALNIPLLKSLLPVWATMKANTACLFLLAGASLWLAQARPSAPWRRTAAQLCGVAAAVVGWLTFSEYLFGWDVGIDQRLFKEAAGAVGTSHPGRMAPMTALNFGMVGVALGLFARRAEHRLISCLTLLPLITSAAAVFGHCYNVQQLYGMASYTTMAFHAAFTFIVLCLGIFFARPQYGTMALVASDSPGGLMLRRLVPLMLCVIALLGWLRLGGQRAGLYTQEFGVALLVLSISIALVILLWRNAWTLHDLDGQRHDVQQALQRANEELERKVQQRSAELAKANEAFRVVVETAQDAIIFADAKGRVVFWNRTTQALFGYSAQEMLGRPLTDIMPERFRSAHEAGLRQFMSTGVPHVVGSTVELVGLRKDGSEFPIELSLAAWTAEGAPHFTAILRDITARKQAEALVNREKEQLATLNKTMLGREERIIEMKQEVNGLLKELSRPEKYRV